MVPGTPGARWKALIHLTTPRPIDGPVPWRGRGTPHLSSLDKLPVASPFDPAQTCAPMSKPAPSAFRIVLIPALITLLVTALRLLGEIQGWSDKWFGVDAGGNASMWGIVWLIPIFGFWFGIRTARAGRVPAHFGRALLVPLIALGVAVGLSFGLMQKAIDLPILTKTYITFAIMVVAMLASASAWPALWRLSLLYGLLARLPIIAITFLAVENNWGTHYEKPHPDLPAMEGIEKAIGLSLAQLFVWVPLTVMVSGILGALGGLLFGGRRS